MLIGRVPDIGLAVEIDTRNGFELKMIRPKCKKDSVKSLRDRSILVEGVRLFNAVPRKIREYSGSYLGFKNLIDIWLNEIPDFPRDIGNEPEARDRGGKPSNSIKDWMKSPKFVNYDDSWVPKHAKTIAMDGCQIELTDSI